MMASAAWPGAEAAALKSAVIPAPIKKDLDMAMRLLDCVVRGEPAAGTAIEPHIDFYSSEPLRKERERWA